MVSSKGKKDPSRKTRISKKPAGDPSAVPTKSSKSVEDEGIVYEIEDYAILTLDMNGNITSWNKGAEKIKGYKAEEILGKNYRIFYTKEDKEQHLSEKLLEQARVNGRANYEGWRLRKDGSRFWGSITLTALHNPSGKVTRFVKVTRDLTEKKMAEDKASIYLEELKFRNEELIKSEDRYHRMIGEVKDYAIILLDKNGKVLDWNEGAEKLKGYAPSEIIGKNFRLF